MSATNPADDEWGHLLALLPSNHSTDGENGIGSTGHADNADDDELRLSIPGSYGREDLLNPFWQNCPTCCLPARSSSSTELPRKRRMKCCEKCHKIQNIAKFIPRKNFLEFNVSKSESVDNFKGDRNNQQQKRKVFLSVSASNASQMIRIFSERNLYEITSTKEVNHGDELSFYCNFNEMGGLDLSMEESKNQPIVRFRIVKKDFHGDENIATCREINNAATFNLGAVASGTKRDCDIESTMHASGDTALETSTDHISRYRGSVDVNTNDCPVPSRNTCLMNEKVSMNTSTTSKQREKIFFEKGEKTEWSTSASTRKNAGESRGDNTLRKKDSDICKSIEENVVKCESECEEDDSEPLTLPNQFFPSYSCNDSPERVDTNTQIHSKHNCDDDDNTNENDNPENASRVVENAVIPQETYIDSSHRKSSEFNDRSANKDEGETTILETKTHNEPQNYYFEGSNVSSKIANDDAVTSKPNFSSNHAPSQHKHNSSIQLLSTLSREELTELRNKEDENSLRHSVISLTLALTSGASSWNITSLRDNSRADGGNSRTGVNKKYHNDRPNGDHWMPRLLRGTQIIMDNKST